MTPMLEGLAISRRFGKTHGIVRRALKAAGVLQKETMVRAVDRASLTLNEGEVVGLVGESGCGKSTLGRILSGIDMPDEGKVRYRGCDLTKLPGRQMTEALLSIQLIFQDPFSSLNPRWRVRDLVGEAPRLHGLVPRTGVDAYVKEVLARVGLDALYLDRFPHEFSGGQRQRIGIARALAVQPKVLICDEAVSALDVSIQAQILNLFMRLRRDLSLTYLFISHDLGVVHHMSDRVAVMYLGRIVEMAATEMIFAEPAHPYTQGLLEEIPRIMHGRRPFKPMNGEIPSPLAPPSGCHFHPRCPQAHARCRVERPMLKEIIPGRFAACHLHG